MSHKIFLGKLQLETRNTGTFSERTGLLISSGTIYSSSETFISPIFIGIVFSVFYVCKPFISITLRIRAEIMTTIILLLFGGRLWSIRLLRFASVNIYMQLNHQGFAVIKKKFCWEKGVTPLLIISSMTDFNLIFIGHILTKSILINTRSFGKIKNPCSTVFYHSTCNRKHSIKKYDYKKRKTCGRTKNETTEPYTVKSMLSFMYPWC